jgi:PIN domain nuclease of toxin-antitoxin system
LKLLLDTHTLLWWLKDDEQLGLRARALIADPGSDVLVSVVTLWEIALKVRLGKLEADIGEVVRATERDGFSLLSITPAHLLALGALPLHSDHRDPFDHLLIAQSLAEGATFVSEDRNTPRYPVRFVTCSDEPRWPASQLQV